MTKADKKIIQNNPSLSPYELLLNKGLSQAGYDELIKSSDTDDANALKASIPRPSVQNLAAQPSTAVFNPNQSATVELEVIATGTSSPVARTQAEKMVRKYPKQYRIK